MPKKILAYEDEKPLRDQLKNLFYSIRSEYELLDIFEDASFVAEHIHKYKPDGVLMDIQMPDNDEGLVALYKIKQVSRDTKVMVLTMFDDDEKIFNAICLGADGYMLKSDFASNKQMPHETISKSLNILFNGGAYLTPSVANRILNLFTDPSIPEKIKSIKDRFQNIVSRQAASNKKNESELTEMQQRVLRKIIDGKKTSEISSEELLSENTINTHIKAIYSKLEVHSRAQAIKKAIELKLMS